MTTGSRAVSYRHLDVYKRQRHLIPAHRNRTVLAKRAMKVAAKAAHGEDSAAREKTSQRFLFNRVQRYCCNLSVIIIDNPVFYVFTRPA